MSDPGEIVPIERHGEYRVPDVFDVDERRPSQISRSAAASASARPAPAAAASNVRSRLSSSTSLMVEEDPTEVKPKPIVIAPPVLRPQHVYAPVAPLGMLSLGVMSRHKDEGGGSVSDFRKIVSGKSNCFSA
jgi:hypothetical protein